MDMVTRNEQGSPSHHVIAFRQAVYQQGFLKRRDAQFELLDALLLSGTTRSFPELSCLPVFRRRWPSVYAALEDGCQNISWLQQYLIQQLPTTPGIQVFALDGTAWPRPAAVTLPDRQYVYSPTKAVNGGSVVVGSPYSLLTWVAEPQSSWALPLDVGHIARGGSETLMVEAVPKHCCPSSAIAGERRSPHLSASRR